MGWAGYGIYDGDGTQTCHYAMLNVLGISCDDEIFRYMGEKTVVSKEKQHLLTENVDKLIAALPDCEQFQDEYEAIEWHMALALYLDNDICPPKQILSRGIEAVYYLMGEHADNFNEPARRKQKLRAFLKRTEKWTKK